MIISQSCAKFVVQDVWWHWDDWRAIKLSECFVLANASHLTSHLTSRALAFVTYDLSGRSHVLQIACPSDCVHQCELLIWMQVADTDATSGLAVLLTSWFCCPLGLAVFVYVTVFRVDGMVVACVGALMCVFLCWRHV
jgi:hypothetical protein